MKKLMVVSLFFLLSAMLALVNNDVQAFDSVVRRIACYARNAHGATFEAIGTYAPKVESSALDKCYRFGSRECYSTGCRVVYLRQGS